MNTAAQTAARSNLYGLLAVGFRYPGAEERAFVATDDFRRSFGECLSRCAVGETAETEALINELAEATDGIDEVEADYLRSFHTNMPTPSASLYESSYRPGADKSALLLELKGFYDNFGLAVAGGFHELEDAITGELEFMHFLTAKEALAEIEGTSPAAYRRAQRDFLNRHLALWAPRFQNDVERKSGSRFYRALAAATRLLVESDASRLAAEPDEAGAKAS